MRWKCIRPGYCVRSNTLCLPRVRWLALQHTVFERGEALQTLSLSLSYRHSAAVAQKSWAWGWPTSYLQTVGLADLLLADRVRLAGRFPQPQHLYSQQQATFPDLVLDDVDQEAKAQALRQPHPPEHLGAGDAPLDGTVRPGANPTPLAQPCEPSTAPRLPRTEKSPASVACALPALGERPHSLLGLVASPVG